jgi:hypothetical protein
MRMVAAARQMCAERTPSSAGAARSDGTHVGHRFLGSGACCRPCPLGRNRAPVIGGVTEPLARAEPIVPSGRWRADGVAPMTEPSLSMNPKHWRDRAEEARSVAELLRDADAKRLMLMIAESYDRRYEQQSASIWARNHCAR